MRGTGRRREAGAAARRRRRQARGRRARGLAYTKVDAAERAGAGTKPQRDPRAESITDMAFVDGKLIVAGLSNEEFASKLRSCRIRSRRRTPGTSVEIFHGNHGQLETRSPVYTFIPYTINNKPHVIASYTCTPLVRFPIDEPAAGTKVVGTTIAELGNRQPSARHDPLQEGRPRVPADVEQPRAA